MYRSISARFYCVGTNLMPARIIDRKISVGFSWVYNSACRHIFERVTKSYVHRLFFNYCKLHPPPVPVLLMSVFFSVLCKSGIVFLCIWRHCKFVSVISYVWHFISPRVNAKLLNCILPQYFTQFIRLISSISTNFSLTTIY